MKCKMKGEKVIKILLFLLLFHNSWILVKSLITKIFNVNL